jgi:thiopeptide-type bacteriocin biosynthesis protein
MRNLQPFDFFVMRKPLLPYQTISKINDILKTSEADFIVALKAFYKDPLVQDAIYISSPELFAQMMQWIDDNDQESKNNKKLVKTLYQYLIRMSGRCTPFGLFAGCSMGEVTGEGYEVNFDQQNPLYKSSRLDMWYVAELASFLTNHSLIKTQLNYTVNNTLYNQGTEHYRYTEYKFAKGKRQYFSSEIKRSVYLDDALSAAKQPVSFDQLVACITGLDIPTDQAQQFIHSLIDNQIILSDLEPSVSGSDAFEYLINRLQKLQQIDHLIGPLTQIRDILNADESEKLKFEQISALLTTHFFTPGAKDLIQTDLYFNTSKNILGNDIIEPITADLQQVGRLLKVRKNKNLDDFKSRFIERYEDQEVALLKAIDAESGIGYGLAKGDRSTFTPLIDGLIFSGGATTEKSFSLDRLNRWLKANFDPNTAVMQLSDSDIDQLAEPEQKHELSSTAYILGNLFKTDKDHLFNLKSYGGNSAVDLLSRFGSSCQGLNEKLLNCTEFEQQSNDKLLAEIIHLPEARVGNVVMRPNMRALEIPVLSPSLLPPEQQIPLSDLMVSVKNNRVILKSQRLNREIVPKLTNAHNYALGLNSYKFLCDMQGQGCLAGFTWSWGYRSDEAYLPRVQYKNIILSRAQWKLNAVKKNEEANITYAYLKNTYNLPEQITLVEGDNELPLDLTLSLGLQILIDKLTKGTVTIKENLDAQYAHVVYEPGNGSYCSELIIPVKTTDAEKLIAPAKKAVPLSNNKISVTHAFAPGSQWFYVKIYTGHKTADRILKNNLLPLIKTFSAEQKIEKWFFIRYADPDAHLRIRFYHSSCPDFWKDVMDALYKHLADYLTDGTISKIQIDTYKRELNRYGAASIEQAESVFYNDSEAVAEFLTYVNGDAGERYRWLFALKGVDKLMDDFGFSVPEKIEIIDKYKDAYFKEFNVDKAFEIQLNDRYRNVSGLIYKFLSGTYFGEDVNIMDSILTLRSQHNIAPIQSINQQVADGALQPQFKKEVISSYIHMFLNRVFLANQRKHELIVAHYLHKYYKSALARNPSPALVNIYG